MTPDNVFDARSRLGLTQKEMAEALGVSRSLYMKWEANADYGRPIPEEKAALIAALLAPSRNEREVASALVTVPRYAEPTPIAGIGVPMLSNDRVAIIGATGSGKTWLATRMLHYVPAFVILTADGFFAMEDVPITAVFDPSLLRQSVYIPDTFTREEQKWQAWDTVQRAVFLHGDRVIYYDELKGINPGTTPRTAFEELITQGRKRNIGVWTGMQRPRGVPRIALSQAEHFHILSTTDPEDRKYLADFIGREESAKIPRENRAVLYCNIKEQRTQYADMDAQHREQREVASRPEGTRPQNRIAAPQRYRQIVERMPDAPLRATVRNDRVESLPLSTALSTVRNRDFSAFVRQAPPTRVMQTVASMSNVNYIPQAIAGGRPLADIADGYHMDSAALLVAIAWVHDDNHQMQDWVRGHKKTIAPPPMPLGPALRMAAQYWGAIIEALQRGEPMAEIGTRYRIPTETFPIVVFLLFRDEPGVGERLGEAA